MAKAAARSRDASATRRAILASAKAAFANAPYDSVGVREIASGAGVTAMLVNRYFGSKEALFAEVIASKMAEPTMLTADVLRSPNLARELATALVGQTRPNAIPLDGLMIMLRSASNEKGAAIWREQIEKHYSAALLEVLVGEAAGERAGVILALIAGFQVMRQILMLPALADGDERALTTVLEAAFNALIVVLNRGQRAAFEERP